MLICNCKVNSYLTKKSCSMSTFYKLDFILLKVDGEIPKYEATILLDTFSNNCGWYLIIHFTLFNASKP